VGSPGLGIAISSLSVSPTMCVVGSEDGYLRLWPLDFSSVLLEAGEAVGALPFPLAWEELPCHRNGAVPSLG
jgi:hypothetical protein